MIGLFRKSSPSSTLVESLATHYNDHEIRTIDRIGTTVTIEAGATLAAEGATGREVVLILEGTAAVSRDGDPVATVGAGDVVGELAVLHNQPRNATVMATTPLTAVVFTGQEFRSVLEECPRLKFKMDELAQLRSAA